MWSTFRQMEFLLPDSEHIQSHHHLPVHLLRYAVPGAQCRYKRFPRGEYITQLVLGNDYSIWSHHFFIKETITAHAVTKDNIVTLHYMLTGTIAATLHGAGEIIIEEGHYRLFYIPGQLVNDVIFQPGVYHCVHINFHPVHLGMIARQYPVFEPMLSKAAVGIKSGHHHVAAVITPQVKESIRQVLHNNLKPVERILFVEAAIRNLLRIYIQDVTGDEDEPRLMDAQKQLIKKVEDYIIHHLDKSLSVNTIARHFGISRSWLQQVSKNVMKEGVHHMVRRKRMEAAANLLLETNHSVSEIVGMTSDMTFAAFSAAFHAYWGITPLQFRKGKGHKL